MNVHSRVMCRSNGIGWERYIRGSMFGAVFGTGINDEVVSKSTSTLLGTDPGKTEQKKQTMLVNI